MIKTLPAWREATARARNARLRLSRSVWNVTCSEVVDSYLGHRTRLSYLETTDARARLGRVGAGRYSLVLTVP